MAIYLDPKNDLTFKKVFGEHKHLCISLINSLLKFKGNEQIKEIEYETTELIPELNILKDSFVDVRCKDKEGREFIVEMQFYWSASFKSRVLFNASKAYVKQLGSGKNYNLLCPVYSLNLVNDVFEHEMEEYYHHYKIVNIENTDKQIKGLEFVFVELPKYKPSSQEQQDYFDFWLRFMTEINESTEEIPPKLTENEELEEAVQYLRESAYTKEQLAAYDKFMDSMRTEQTALIDAKNIGFADGRAEGIEKGRAEGIEKGRAEGELVGEARGIEKGKTEGAKSIISLLESGMSLEEAKRKLGM